MELAPIILFTYNRPEHTRRTLESLAANDLAGDSELYIFSDGPRPDATKEQKAAIEKVREVIRSADGFKKVEITEEPVNKGLAASIIDGITKVINEKGKIIVVEDDLILSRGFLKYMNDALDLYEDEEKVMHISGYMFPLDIEMPETFFYNVTTCWGWATWKRAWDKLITDARYLKKELKNRNQLESFNLDNHGDFLIQLDFNIKKLTNTWAIKWHASVFLAGGFCLHPGKSLCQNIGFDELGSNTNKLDNNIFNDIDVADYINVRKEPLQESESVRNAMMQFYDSLRGSNLKLWLYKNYTKSPLISKIFQLYFKNKRFVESQSI